MRGGFAAVLAALAVLAAASPAAAVFSWKNCGESDDPFQVQSLELTPDPVVLGKNITLAFKATLKGANLTSGGKAEVKIWKKEGIWITIPCVDQVGSCDYDNLCSLIPQKPCGPILTKYNIPCKCPFPEGDYAIPVPVNIDTKNPGLSWLTDGELSAQGTVINQDGARLGCYLVYLSVSTAEKAEYLRTGRLPQPQKVDEMPDHPYYQK